MKLANIKVNVIVFLLSVFAFTATHGQAASTLACSASDNRATEADTVGQSTTFRFSDLDARNAINGDLTDATATRADDSAPSWHVGFNET